MASASRGLPGFLRRSLRAELSEDSDAEDLDPDDQEQSQSSLPNDATQQPGKDQLDPATSPDSTQESISDSVTSFAANSSVSSRASMPPLSSSSTPLKNHRSAVPPPPPPTAPLSRQSSEPQQPRSSQDEGTATLKRSSTVVPKSTDNLHGEKSSRPKTYRETQFEKIYAANVISMNDLKSVAWNGIPPHFRPQSWKILLGYLPTNASRRQHTLQKKRAEYLDAVAQHYDIDDNSRTMQEQEVLRQVLVDVPRTAPTVKLFRNERIKSLLTRILYIWAMRHPASSYVQGINDLAMPLIVTYLTMDDYDPSTDNNNHKAVDNNNNQEVASKSDSKDNIDYTAVLEGTIMDTVTDEQLQKVEADVYWSLTNLLAGIQDHYTSDQPGVQRMVLRLEELVNRIDADLCAHLRDTGIEFMQFAFKWMNCLLLREFNLKCVIRLWDTYISEEDGFEDFHVYVCAAFLCQFSSRLQTMTFDELFGFMQGIPTEDWGDTEVEMLLSQAYVLSTLFGGSDAHLAANSTDN
ncbi:GTPase-activating protein GYP1 [Seminavis robusta]|uniref:GTPase-activating protein GYP1 n=1 Tax=Seminavis robusta TaxID=568900 RepID=A0A9N8E059_9STRA|nr:GTPase-activating protein GYP1 [Seminavis robusta]|eukprot:Sro518_g158780.1 GTPase-activating protein GYP1 (521) ;mRNA; r:16906-18867